MKNKKLSEQQKTRMKKVSLQQKLSEAANSFLEGVVIAHHGRHLSAEVDNTLYTLGHSRRFSPVVGDRILFQPISGSESKVVEILPRKTELKKLEHKHEKVLAANIDQVIVVLAPHPQPWPELLAQYLTYLSLLNIPAVIVVNKKDLGPLPEGFTPREEYIKNILGIPYLHLSSRDQTTMKELIALLENKTSVFIGPSGVGKSSLIRKILPEIEEIRVGDLSQAGKGNHTTSVTRLYKSSENVGLIDSPGIRQCDLGQLSLADLQKAFRDLNRFGCRFKDCDHRFSQGCAVWPAQQDDVSVASRYHDYLFLWDKFVSVRF